jgi:hypothetical protein
MHTPCRGKAKAKAARMLADAMRRTAARRVLRRGKTCVAPRQDVCCPAARRVLPRGKTCVAPRRPASGHLRLKSEGTVPTSTPAPLLLQFAAEGYCLLSWFVMSGADANSGARAQAAGACHVQASIDDERVEARAAALAPGQVRQVALIVEAFLGLLSTKRHLDLDLVLDLDRRVAGARQPARLARTAASPRGPLTFAGTSRARLLRR